MPNFQTISLGNTEIRFFSSRLAEKDVQQAASLVAPSFENLPKDTFISLATNGQQVIAAIPAKPQSKTFPVPIQKISIQEAIRQSLEQAANFLKVRA